METRYFKGTGSLGGMKWRWFPNGMIEVWSFTDPEWTDSICSIQTLQTNPDITETDSEGNLTDR